MKFLHLEELKHFLTVKETAQFMGVSADTVYRLISSGKLSAKRISPRKTVITADELDRYLSEI